jgi:hypothetical protein
MPSLKEHIEEDKETHKDLRSSIIDLRTEVVAVKVRQAYWGGGIALLIVLYANGALDLGRAVHTPIAQAETPQAKK